MSTVLKMSSTEETVKYSCGILSEIWLQCECKFKDETIEDNNLRTLIC